MNLLVLGGTQWLGREVAGQAVAAGDSVTCLARGESGAVAPGATLVAADRNQPDAYDAVADRDWDAVVEVSWQPRFVREALAAIGPRAGHWSYVSSGNVYASHAEIGADESAPLLEPTDARRGGPRALRRGQVGVRAVVAGTPSETGCSSQGPGSSAAPETPPTGPATGSPGRRRRPDDPMLVPDAADQPSQVIDVRDLAAWLLACARTGTTGAFNTVGPDLPLGRVDRTVPRGGRAHRRGGQRAEGVAARP